MDYDTALTLHKKQWVNHHNFEYTFPYNHLYKNDKFMVVDIEISSCVTQELDEHRVTKYVKVLENGGELGPSWIMMGKKLANGTVKKFWHLKNYVVDGNHRMVAKKRFGLTKCKVIVPQSHYDQIMRN